MDWFRWHHGTVSDPKWRIVAADSGQPVHAVLAVWSAMLECASSSSTRGRLDGWNSRVVGVSLDMPTEAVDAILRAMVGLVIDETPRNATKPTLLLHWEKRQPKRERDDLSTDRVRAWRERQAVDKAGEPDAPAPETPRNATKRPDKRRSIKENPNLKVRAKESRRHGIPVDWWPDAELLAYADAKAGWKGERAAEEVEKFRDHHAKLGNEFADERAAWRTWVRNGAKYDAEKAQRLGAPTEGNWRSLVLREAV